MRVESELLLLMSCLVKQEATGLMVSDVDDDDDDDDDDVNNDHDSVTEPNKLINTINVTIQFNNKFHTHKTLF